MDSLDGYEDGELTMREYNHRPKECNGSKDCDKENMRNIELCDALCRKKNEKMKYSIARLKYETAY